MSVRQLSAKLAAVTSDENVAVDSEWHVCSTFPDSKRRAHKSRPDTSGERSPSRPNSSLGTRTRTRTYITLKRIQSNMGCDQQNDPAGEHNFCQKSFQMTIEPTVATRDKIMKVLDGTCRSCQSQVVLLFS